jgi:uncharacterized protein (DUF362 family)
MAKVVFKKLKKVCLEEIYDCTVYIVDELGIDPVTIGKTCLVKINAISRELLPGRNTSPWVFEAVLKVLANKFPGVTFTVADSDGAGYAQFDDSMRNWGYGEIARQYGARIVNLAHDDYRRVEINDPRWPYIEIPVTVLESDSIVNVPVLKTHVLTGITCCLKNHWGMLPRLRYQYHVRASEIIAEMNRQIGKTVLNIVDATICMEGSGPKTGKPKICSVLFGGRDRVAVDAAVVDFMGLPMNMARHILLSEELGVGTTRYEVAGDPFEKNAFEPPSLGGDVVALLERKLRAIPMLGEILYAPSIARVLGLIGTKYNELFWYRKHGKRLRSETIGNNEYLAEYKNLVTD